LLLGSAGVLQWLPYYTGKVSTLATEDPELWRLWTEAPGWAELGYGLGISGMFVGAVGFALRRRWSMWCFAAGAAGLLAHRTWLFLLSGLADLLFSYSKFTLFIAIVVDLCAIVIVRAGHRRGWVR